MAVNFYLRINSNCQQDLRQFDALMRKNTYHAFEKVYQIFSIKNKSKRFAILTSPHVNKTAQENFETRTFNRQYNIFLHRRQQYFIFLKKLNHCLLPNLNIKLKFFKKSSVNDALNKIFNMYNFTMKKFKNNIKKLFQADVNSIFKIADVLGNTINHQQKMLLTCENLIKILPIIRSEFYIKETCFFISTNLLNKIMCILKNHYAFQFKILSCISGVDYPENFYRFHVVYELLSTKYNARIRIKTCVNELTPIDSIENVFSAASWWECEIWDMFGVFFLNQKNLCRLLTDYGFQGYPLRKDFPVIGFSESRYSLVKSRVVYENVEITQEFRSFDCISPWDFVKFKNNNRQSTIKCQK